MASMAQMSTFLAQCYNIVITMKRIQTTIRSIGNSRGVVIPKPLLVQLGLTTKADMTIEGDALVLRRPAIAHRDGWAEAAQKVAQEDADLPPVSDDQQESKSQRR